MILFNLKSLIIIYHIIIYIHHLRDRGITKLQFKLKRVKFNKIENENSILNYKKELN